MQRYYSRCAAFLRSLKKIKNNFYPSDYKHYTHTFFLKKNKQKLLSHKLNMLVLVIFCTFATRNGDVEVLNKFDDYGIKKKHPNLGAFCCPTRTIQHTIHIIVFQFIVLCLFSLCTKIVRNFLKSTVKLNNIYCVYFLLVFNGVGW